MKYKCYSLVMVIYLKVQEVKGRYSIGIPKDIIKAKKWTKGIELLLVFNERGNVELKEI